jgi:type II secretory pathway pseudopilin PulG
MRRLILMGLLVLMAAPAAAQAPTLKAAVEKARETEQRAMLALQATDAYKLWKAASDVRQQLDALIKAETTPVKPHGLDPETKSHERK